MDYLSEPSKCNLKYLCNREADKSLTTDRREANMTTEAEIGVTRLGVKEFQQSPEAGRGEEQILPYSFQK